MLVVLDNRVSLLLPHMIMHPLGRNLHKGVWEDLVEDLAQVERDVILLIDGPLQRQGERGNMTSFHFGCA